MWRATAAHQQLQSCVIVAATCHASHVTLHATHHRPIARCLIKRRQLGGRAGRGTKDGAVTCLYVLIDIVVVVVVVVVVVFEADVVSGVMGCYGGDIHRPCVADTRKISLF
jgi:hypothetical protein